MFLKETFVVLELFLKETLAVLVLILTLLLLVVDHLRLVIAHCFVLVLRCYPRHLLIIDVVVVDSSILTCTLSTIFPSL